MRIRLFVRMGVCLAVGGLLLLGGVACQGLEDGQLVAGTPNPGSERPPLPRRTGARLPAFSGGDPTRRGWTKVDGLVWIDAAHAQAYAAGQVYDGFRYVPVTQPLPAGTPASQGYRLRTDHVALHTNASWRGALVVAREAEAHVQRLVGQFGDALGLRLPQGPLKVVVTRTRAEFVRTLAALVAKPVGWGAFYDARTGIVYTSLEPAARGGLPWQSDLRHEMTHQVLDLSRPGSRRTHAFPVPWFWLWEGIAIWTEDLGGGPTTEREGRFRRRYANNDWQPIVNLVQLPQERFEGKHYDQTGSFMRFLMDPRQPATRAATLQVVRDLLQGPVAPDALERAAGQRYGDLEARWRATVGR